MSKKVAVSACLLGYNCRYDGTNRKESMLVKSLEDCEVIPFCPEDAILGTPRETIDIVESKAIGNESGVDYTAKIEKYARDFINQNRNIDQFIVKSKSPSCALHSAKYYDKEKKLLGEGSGIFTKTVQKRCPNVMIEEKG